jgi:hypothetical protein
MRNLLLLLALSGLVWAENAGGIKWTPPGVWKTQPERPMRAATYTVPAAGGDAEPGEFAVFYFGPGQGGGTQANLDRWQAQFSEKAGPAKTAQTRVEGMTVTTIDLSGTYQLAPNPMAQQRVAKPGFRLLGAVVEAPEGAVFFKFTGPAKTVAANEAAFKALLNGIKKEK